MTEKEQTIGPSVYEQLEEMLNKCIWLGRKPWGGSIRLSNVKCANTISFYDYGGYEIDYCSYHDLFSKDSGLLDFSKFKKHSTGFHYMIMGPMTATEKAQYFVNNAIIPTIKSE